MSFEAKIEIRKDDSRDFFIAVECTIVFDNQIVSKTNNLITCYDSKQFESLKSYLTYQTTIALQELDTYFKTKK